MGVTLIWPIALSLLAGGIVIMYLLKQHAEEFKVPSLFLWTEMYKNQTADKPWEKLKKNILMVLEIITILVLVLALMGPYVRFGKGKGSTVLVIIDTSASMDSRYSASETRLESAKKDAEKFIKNLPNSTMVSVITSNTESNVLVSATSDKLAAVSAVKSIKQTARGGNCEEGVKTARALYNAYKDAAVVLFTDTFVSTDKLNASIYDYSGDIENAGIDYVFSNDNGDDSFTVVAGVSNYGKNDMSLAVDLYEVSEKGEKKMVATQDITIPAGDSSQVVFESVTLATKGIAVGIGSNDDLDADNMYYASSNVKKDAEVLLYTKGSNTFLEKAIRLVDGIKLIKSSTVDGFAEKSGYNLYIFDCLGNLDMDNLPKDGNIMIVGCKTGLEMSGQQEKVVLSGKNQYGSYDVPVNSTYTYLLPANNESLFVTAEGYSAGYIGGMEDRKLCMIGFDFHNTDFPLTMNFPILIYDIIKELTDTNAVDKTEISAGEDVRISLSGINESIIIDPSGKSVKVSALDRYTATEELGCYTVKGETPEDDTVFTVNFVQDESNVGKMQSATGGDAEIKTGGGNSILNLRAIIIAIAIVLLMVEWIFYIRQ